MEFVEIFDQIEKLDTYFLTKYKTQFQEWEKMGVKYAHIVYIKNDKNKVVFFSGSTTNFHVNESMCFQELYHSLKITTKHQFNLLGSLYGVYTAEDIIQFFEKIQTDDDPYLQQLLSRSNGYLVFKEDFKKILMDKCNYSDEDAYNMQLSWNKKSISKINLLRHLQFDDSRTIYDVMINKSITNELSPLLELKNLIF